MSSGSLLSAEAPLHEHPAQGGLPRLLAGIPADGPMTLYTHLAVHGPLPAESRRRRRAESPLIGRVERAGLRGRGGAGFPTALKLRAVAGARRRAVMVVNAAEGEPASRKDRTLCEVLPHLVLDGAQLAARAVGAGEVIVCTCESALGGGEGIAAAIEERAGTSGGEIAMSVVPAPAGYVSGQETALVNYLNGGAAVPTFTPPAPYQQGVRRRPTLINNAETCAHIALIARHGSQWFRQLGMPSQPGSALVTLSGPVASPGVYEIEHGASLRSLLDAAGGTTAPVRAMLIGGYGGSWIGEELLRGVALSQEHLAPHGASLGAGVLLLLSAEACPVAETARAARWMARESSRQCGPCLNGLDAIAASIEQIAGAGPESGATRRLELLLGLVRRRGACAHPDGAANLVASALETFAPEFADHARHGTCEACMRPSELPLPAHPPDRPAARRSRWAS